MKEGDSIFVNGYLLEEFFKNIHPKIPMSYILISHNSDNAVPHKFFSYLNDSKIISWFGQNVHLKHPKIIALPIGLANSQYKHGNIQLLKKIQKQKPEKKNLLYMNFLIENYPRNRSKVYEIFAGKNYCYIAKNKTYEEYLKDIAESKFVLSPRGNGLDCHRTWEALYLGSVPIVESSALDPLFENLPVLIIKNWEEINEEMLNNFYEKTKNEKFQKEKLFMQYWHDLIKENGKKL